MMVLHRGTIVLSGQHSNDVTAAQDLLHIIQCIYHAKINTPKEDNESI
jgi:hypothetical protein